MNSLPGFLSGTLHSGTTCGPSRVFEPWPQGDFHASELRARLAQLRDEGYSSVVLPFSPAGNVPQLSTALEMCRDLELSVWLRIESSIEYSNVEHLSRTKTGASYLKFQTLDLSGSALSSWQPDETEMVFALAVTRTTEGQLAWNEAVPLLDEASALRHDYVEQVAHMGVDVRLFLFSREDDNTSPSMSSM
jgi:hypothetical protein